MEARITAGEINGIINETFEKLQDCLRKAIYNVSRPTRASIEPSPAEIQEGRSWD